MSDKTDQPAIKDLWGTPKHIANYFISRYDLNVDVAADKYNAKCALFLTEQDDGLTRPWALYGNVWCNPPFSAIRPWVNKAIEESKQGCRIVMLLPANTDTHWFNYAIESGAYCYLITPGRIRFMNALTGRPAGQNTRGSLVLLWNCGCTGNQIQRLNIKEAIAK